ncbi:MAG: hypothetical protein A2Z83_04550 [Omnitrophica bacterium GWA2_52_8]|nr:MAG: hypothetical protein A2Z83_04550 [Omnitrophica bacterium GWA2_52_8]
MNIPEPFKRYFKRNNDDFDELMMTLEKETSFLDSPPLSLLYGSGAVRKSRTSVPMTTENKA